MKVTYIIWGFLTILGVSNAVDIGKTLPIAVLEKENGGNSTGQVWKSQSLTGKTHVIVYMDPDKRKEVKPFLDRLNHAGFDTKKYSTVAIVNLAATWMPDAILETMLSKKQKELHNTAFIFDKTKYLVKKWQLKDDASNVIICDKNEKVLYTKSGKLSASDIDEIMKIVKKDIQ